jgi:hypothetical protein
MQRLRGFLVGSFFLAAMQAWPQEPAGEPDAGLPARKYEEGEAIVYNLRATTQGRDRITRYTARASGIVRKTPSGAYYEDLEWTDVAVDGTPVALPQAVSSFRQRLSLAPDAPPQIPNLAQVHPSLVGPIVDLLNFYADVLLVTRVTGLARAGDHVYLNHNRPNSWADGRYLLVGEDAVDFDITLRDLDASGRTATFVVRHVPPAAPAIKITADWMGKPVAAAPNNWTQLGRNPAGKYTAAVGSAVVNVTLVMDLGRGRLLSATMDNPVEILERDCQDVAATRCGEPVRYRITRTIELLPVSVPRS